MISITKPSVTYLSPKKNNVRGHYNLFFFLYIINSVCALWEWDTYHIWDDFIAAGIYGNFEILGYEEVYNWLASITGNHYFLWRFFIWAPACLFIYWTAEKLFLCNRNFLLSLALFAGFAAYTRGMLGHTMLVWGLVLLIDKNNSPNRVIGILIIFASYFFHKSMYINIVFAIIALYPFGKKSLILSLVAFPFLVIAANRLVNIISSGVIDVSLGEGVGGVGDRTLSYVEAEKSEVNSNGVIGRIISYLPEYLALYYMTNRVIFKGWFQDIKQARIFTYLYRLSYISIYIASLFFFVETSQWIYLRFKYMGFFPLIFVLGKLWSMEPKGNFLVKAIILTQLFALALKYLLLLLNWYAL